jgi:hypothetical protein
MAASNGRTMIIDKEDLVAVPFTQREKKTEFLIPPRGEIPSFGTPLVFISLLPFCLAWDQYRSNRMTFQNIPYLVRGCQADRNIQISRYAWRFGPFLLLCAPGTGLVRFQASRCVCVCICDCLKRASASRGKSDIICNPSRFADASSAYRFPWLAEMTGTGT